MSGTPIFNIDYSITLLRIKKLSYETYNDLLFLLFVATCDTVRLEIVIKFIQQPGPVLLYFYMRI